MSKTLIFGTVAGKLESMLERDQGKVQMMDYFSVNKIQCIARILKSTERVKGVLVTEFHWE